VLIAVQEEAVDALVTRAVCSVVASTAISWRCELLVLSLQESKQRWLGFLNLSLAVACFYRDPPPIILPSPTIPRPLYLPTPENLFFAPTFLLSTLHISTSYLTLPHLLPLLLPLPLPSVYVSLYLLPRPRLLPLPFPPALSL